MFSRLIKFVSVQGDKHYFTDLSAGGGLPRHGATLIAYNTLNNLLAEESPVHVQFAKVTTSLIFRSRIIAHWLLQLLSPFPCRTTLVFYAHFNGVGTTPTYREVKPVAAFEPAGSNTISIPSSDATLDYEPALVFVTAQDCRDVSSAQAKDYILGYTCGFRVGGIASIGPTLLHSSLANFDTIPTTTLSTNEHLGAAVITTSALVTRPETILAHASIDMTIPAGTAFMVPSVRSSGGPRVPLQDGDVVKVDIEGVGTLHTRVSLINSESVRIVSTEFRGADRACVPS